MKAWQNHCIYYGLAKRTICVEIGFLKKIVRKTRQESSLLFLNKHKLNKLLICCHSGPQGGPKNTPFSQSPLGLFFHLGFLWRPWSCPGRKMDPKGQGRRIGAPRGPKSLASGMWLTPADSAGAILGDDLVNCLRLILPLFVFMCFICSVSACVLGNSTNT